MAAEDRRRGWYLGFGDTNLIPKSRWLAYSNLEATIYPSLHVKMEGYDEGMSFIFAGGGEAIGPDWAKGIAFLPPNLEKNGVLVTNLDEAHKLPENTYLRPIESNWYIFYGSSE